MFHNNKVLIAWVWFKMMVGLCSFDWQCSFPSCHHDETKAKAEEKWGETCFWVKKRRKIFSSDTTCWNSSTRAKIAYFCIRFDLTIGLAIKNYPKLTLDMLTSIHWIKCYVNVFFHVSWCVQWPHHWIGLKKLPQNDPWHVEICPLDQKIQWNLNLSQLFCTVIVDLTSILDWPWKTILKWPLTCQNPTFQTMHTSKYNYQTIPNQTKWAEKCCMK